MTRLTDLNEERARVVRRLRELHGARDRGEDWDDDEEIQLSRALAAIEAEITELGGSLDPVPRDGDAPADGGAGDAPPADPPAPDGTPAGADPPGEQPPSVETHLGSPPDSIDPELNELIDAYERAQREAADHAMSERDDWTCSHGDPRVHAGCSIWWRGELENLLAQLRDAAERLIEDVAGTRTLDEVKNEQDMTNLRQRELTPLERQIREVQERLDRLLEQFEEDEKVYKALRDAGGDIAPYTGVVSAGRHRLLFDIAELQKELTRLYGLRTGILTRLLDMRKRGGAERRNRGLDRARDRWPGVDLDLPVDDDALLRRLLGDEQFDKMDAERRRQGQQMRRQLNRRTSMVVPRPAILALVAILLLAGLVVGVVILTGDDEPVASAADADSSGDSDAVVDLADDEPELVDVDTNDTTASLVEPVGCVLDTELELVEIIVEPGSHHQGNIEVRVTDAEGGAVDGAEISIATDKSDGTRTQAVGTTQGGAVIFGMQTTAYGENTLTVTDVAMLDCTWEPTGDTSVTWQAEP